MLRIISAQVKTAQYFGDDLDRTELNPPRGGNTRYRLVGMTEDHKKIPLSAYDISENELDWNMRSLVSSFPEYWEEHQVVNLSFEDETGREIPVPEYARWVQDKMSGGQEAPSAEPSPMIQQQPPEMPRPFPR